MGERPKSVTAPETSILIVDDNPQYSNLLKRILGGVLGYRDITTVASTHEALALIQSDPDKFKLLFVDYNFPQGETGGQLLTDLSDQKLLQDKIAFLITSEPTLNNQKEARAAGAVGVVAKPFDRESLRKQIQKAELSLKTDNSENF